MDQVFETALPGFTIRFARRTDAAQLLEFTRSLAQFQSQLDHVHATPKDLEVNMFDRHGAEALIAELDGKPVGMAFYCISFSTYMGKPCLYLMDLFVLPELRGRGYAKALLAQLAAIAIERDYARMEWWCYEWNENALALYHKAGSEKLDEVRVHCMEGGALEALARQAGHRLTEL